MTLRIDNQTDWDGRDLRTLCRRVIKHTDGRYDRRIRIAVSKKRNKEWRWERTEGQDESLYRGRASLGSTRKCYMGVPMVYREVDGDVLTHDFDEHQFARVLEHELAHQRGLRHGDMVDRLKYCRQDIAYNLSDINVEPKPSIEVPQAAGGQR